MPRQGTELKLWDMPEDTGNAEITATELVSLLPIPYDLGTFVTGTLPGSTGTPFFYFNVTRPFTLSGTWARGWLEVAPTGSDVVVNIRLFRDPDEETINNITFTTTGGANQFVDGESSFTQNLQVDDVIKFEFSGVDSNTVAADLSVTLLGALTIT